MTDVFDFSRFFPAIAFEGTNRKPILSWPRNNYAVILWGSLSPSQRDAFTELNTVKNYSAFPCFFIAYARAVMNHHFSVLFDKGLISKSELDYLTTPPQRVKL